MANNEDYLDSLLRAAASQDNPDSAINKVRKIENERAEEEARLQGEEEARIRAEEEAKLLAQAEAETITEEPVSIEEPVITEEPLVAEDSITLEEPVTIEEPTVLEEPVAAEEPAPVEEPIIIEEPAAVEEPVAIEEPEVPEEPLVAEKPVAVEEPLTIEEPAAIEEPVAIEESPDSSNENMSSDDIAALLNSLDSPESAPEEAATDIPAEEAPIDETPIEDSLTSDLDALLNSDFSGEVEMPDVSSLLENAEAFALEENGAEEPQEESSGDIMDLSSDDMEKLINSASDVSSEGEGNGEMEVDLSDMASLEGELGIFDKNDISGATGEEGGSDEGELAEISSLLQAIDSNEVENTEEADVLDMLNEAVSKQEEADAEQEAWAENKKFDDKKKEEAKEAAPKKEKKSLLSIFKKKKPEGEETPKEKKETPFTKLIDFLTASDDDDEDGENANLINATDAPSEGGEGFEDVPGENKEILNEMDKEGEEGKGKKKKKKKKKKGEPSEGEASDEDGDGEGEEGETAGGKKKKKKAKKEKGEKKPLILDIDTAKPLSKRNVKLIAFLAATLLLLIILFTKLVPGVITNSSARKAFYRGDYETTYKSFYGEKKLSDSDRILFNRSEVILKMQHKYDAYKAYSDMGKYMEALDQLLQAVTNYEKWLFMAESCGATEEFNRAYATVLGTLSQTYGISEADAKEIIALPTDLEYSLKVYSIVYHTDYIDPNVPMPGEFVPPVEEIIEEPVYEDMLPEEGN